MRPQPEDVMADPWRAALETYRPGPRAGSAPIKIRPSVETAGIEPLVEMAAWEALWAEPGASVKTLADRFRADRTARPSHLVSDAARRQSLAWIRRTLRDDRTRPFPPGICVHGQDDYPEKLRDAVHPVELLYYLGDWSLVFSDSVAVVGARRISRNGRLRTRRVVQALVEAGRTIVSGLSAGVDTIAHKVCLEQRGRVIGVIATPLDEACPPEILTVQTRIVRDHLLISQVPFRRYGEQLARTNVRTFVPERDVTMSAVSDATIIVEVCDTSSTLHQARTALEQGRALFILGSCFERTDLGWLARFEQQGAVRVDTINELLDRLPAARTRSAKVAGSAIRGARSAAR